MENEKYCASCGELFGENDDIVACESCGSRYHRHCYSLSENGVCRCQYDRQAVFKAPPHTLDVRIGSSENYAGDREKRCFFCGAQFPPSSQFCPNCGSPTPSGGISAEEIALIGGNAKAYAEKFEKIRRGRLSWNWWAFLWTPFWFFYRKMYAFGILSIAVQYTARILMGKIGPLFQLLFYIMFGFIADSMYMGRIERLCRKAEGLYGDEREDFFRQKGGVSYIAPILLGIGFTAAVFTAALFIEYQSIRH